MLGAQWVVGHADAVLARAGAGPDGQNRRHRSGTAEAVRARAREPRARGLAAGARPHRHGADARTDSRGQENHAALSRRTRPRQRKHHLADRHRLSRSGADSGGMVRTAPGFSQLPDRPRRRRHGSRRKISRAARSAAGAMAKKPGLGTAEAIPDWPAARFRVRRPVMARHRQPIQPSKPKAHARPAGPAVRIRRTGRARHRGRRGAAI